MKWSRHIHGTSVALFSYLHSATGTGEWWTTKLLTLPINVRLILPKPRDPITIMDAFTSLAFDIMATPGMPSSRITSPSNWKIAEFEKEKNQK